MRTGRRRADRVTAIALGVAALLLPLGTSGTALATAPTDPPPTDAPPDTAPSTSPTTEAGGGEDDDAETRWLLIALIAGGVVVLAVGLAAFLRRPGAPARSGEDVTVRREQASVLATAQWVHDQLSVELLTAPVEQTTPRWAEERRRIDHLVIVATRHSTSRDDLWAQLAGAAASLSLAIDTSLQLRLQQPPNRAMITDADSVTARRRAELGAVLGSLWPSVRSGG